MRIKRIVIERFRSIMRADIQPSEFNIFVGQNNHGKTNLFEAVQWFYTPGKSADPALVFGKKTENPDEPMSVTIEFTGALGGAKRMKHEANKTKILKLLGEHDEIKIKRIWPGKQRQAFLGDEEVALGTGIDSALNDFLPRLEYIDTRKYFDDVAKYGKGSPVTVMLSGVLATILERSAHYREFQTKFSDLFGSEESEVKIELDGLSKKVKIYLAKQFPDCSKVTFDVTPPVFEDLLKSFETSVDDGIETTAAEKGDGMQRALMLSILQAYADFRKENEDIGKSFLFFIDEAELHLHPKAQRNLKNVLLSIAKDGDQVFLNTHSSVLVVDEQDTQSIFKVEKVQQQTGIVKTEKSDKPNIVFDLLGGTPADLLLPRNFLIVEGKCELIVISGVIARYYGDKPEIQIVQANGDLVQSERSINAIEQAFKPLERSLYGDKTVILVDKPKKEITLTDFQKKHPDLAKNGQLLSLPVGSIEEYYPNTNGWRKTEAEVGRMDSHQKVKLAEKVATEISQVEFEMDMKVIFDALSKCWKESF